MISHNIQVPWASEFLDLGSFFLATFLLLSKSSHYVKEYEVIFLIQQRRNFLSGYYLLNT